MNYLSKENIKQQFRKPSTFYYIIFWAFAIFAFAFAVFIPYFSLSKSFNKHSIDYWAMFWTFISALTVPGAIISYFVNKAREIKNNNRTQVENMIINKVPDFWLATQNYDSLSTSNKNSELAQESQNKMLAKGISLLTLYSKIQNSSPKIKKDLFPYIYLICQKLKPFAGSVPEAFGLSQIFDDILDENDSSSNTAKAVLSTSNILLIRTTRDPASDADILGNWIISSKKAEEIKYIIGVSGYVNSAKKYIKTLRVESFTIIDDKRIKFKKSFKPNNEDRLLRLLKNVTGETDPTSTIETLIEDLIDQTDWKGINPTVYLSHLEALYKEHKQTKDKR